MNIENKNFTKKRMFLLIKFYGKELNINDLTNFRKVGKFTISYIRNKDYNYIEFENPEHVDFVYFNKSKKYRYINGKFIKFFRIDKPPLDLNLPNKILIIIISFLKEKFEINVNFIFKFFKSYSSEINKITIYHKNNNYYTFVDLDNLKDAIKLKKQYEDFQFENLDIKTYFSEKFNILITKLDKFNYDKNFNSQKSKKFKSERDINKNLNILSKRKIIKINNFKINEYEFDNFDNKNKFTLYLLNLYDDLENCKNNFNGEHLFNIFSLYGTIEKILINNDFKRALIYYNNEKDLENSFNIIQEISIDILLFKIYKPKSFNNLIHKAFLIDENLLQFMESLNKLEEFNINNNNLLNKKKSFYDDLKIKIKENLNINLKITYIPKMQRKDFFSFKRQNYPSNYLILKNVSKNFNLCKLKTKILNIFDEKDQKRIQPVFLLFKKINRNNDYVLICYSLEVSLIVIKLFHNYKYEDRKLNINFLKRTTIEKFQNIYNINVKCDVPNYFMNKNEPVVEIQKKFPFLSSHNIIYEKKPEKILEQKIKNIENGITYNKKLFDKKKEIKSNKHNFIKYYNGEFDLSNKSYNFEDDENKIN